MEKANTDKKIAELFARIDPKNPPGIPKKLQFIAAYEVYRNKVLKMFDPVITGTSPSENHPKFVDYYKRCLSNIYSFPRDREQVTRSLLLAAKDLNILNQWAYVLVDQKEEKPRFIKYLKVLKVNPFARVAVRQLVRGEGAGFTGGAVGASGEMRMGEPGMGSPGMGEPESGMSPGEGYGPGGGGDIGAGGVVDGGYGKGRSRLGAGAKDIVTLPKPNKGDYREIKYHMEFVVDLRSLESFVAWLLNNPYHYLTVDYVRWNAITTAKRGKFLHEQLVMATINGRLLHFEWKYEDYLPKSGK